MAKTIDELANLTLPKTSEGDVPLVQTTATTEDNEPLTPIPPEYIPNAEGTVELVTDSQVVFEQQQVYYYLGYVLEAVKKFTNDANDKTNLNLEFHYADIESNQTVSTIYNKFLDQEGVEKVIASEKLTNVFEVPLYKEKVDSILLSYNTPVLELVRSLLDDNIHALPGIQLAAREEGGVVVIFVASSNLGGLETEMIGKATSEDLDSNTTLYINFGSKNSLCESIDLTSKLDPNAFEVYQLPVSVVGNSDTLTTGRLGDQLKKAGLDQAVSNIITKIRNERVQNLPEEEREAALKDFEIDAPTVLSMLIQDDVRNYKRIVRALLNEQDIFGHLLGFYLKRTTIQIHGTVGINAYNLLGIRGLVKSIQGIYNILQVTEQIGKDSYNTVIEAALRKPF